MFLGRSAVSPKTLENVQNSITRKSLNGPVIRYDFFKQRVENYKVVMFQVDQRCHPKHWQFFKTLLLKYGWTVLLDIMIFGIRKSRSLSMPVFKSIRGVTQNFENCETVLLKNGWTALIDFMIFEISTSRSIKQTCLQVDQVSVEFR